MTREDSTTFVLTGIGVDFGGLTALDDITCTMSGPGTVGLIGPNGAGKTTLLGALSGFVRPTRGTIELNGRDMTTASSAQLVQAGIGRSFQSARLLEEETVLTNVLLGSQPDSARLAATQFFGLRGTRRSERQWRERAAASLDALGIADSSHMRADQLSTATRRLVEIARVLQSRPRVIFLDEPAAGLDAGSRIELAETLRQLPEELGCLLVLVEHDVQVVRRVCERSIALVSGRIVTDGPTDSVLDAPEVRAAYFGDNHADT